MTITKIGVMAHGKRVLFDLTNVEDHVQRVIFASRDWYERGLLEEIYSRVKSGTILDVGAHVGNHTLWFAGVMGLRVVAFEPNPTSYAALVNNLALNHLTGMVDARPNAVTDAPCRMRVIDDQPGNSGMARCVADRAGEVQALTIDALKLSDVSAIKIDVEGGEIAVLKGASTTIRRCRPFIYAEAADAPAAQALREYLHALDYSECGVWARTPVHGFMPNERRL